MRNTQEKVAIVFECRLKTALGGSFFVPIGIEEQNRGNVNYFFLPAGRFNARALQKQILRAVLVYQAHMFKKSRCLSGGSEKARAAF